MAAAGELVFLPNNRAKEALQQPPPEGSLLAIQHLPGIAFTFSSRNPALPTFAGGPDITRGLVVLPSPRVSPQAYAPYARDVALLGYFSAVAEAPSASHVIQILLSQPHLKHWAFAAHGSSGHLAARLAVALLPKVRSLLLLASSLPPDLHLRDVNLAVAVLYGERDTVVPPASVEESFSRMAGDAYIIPPFENLAHYDFVHATRGGNGPECARCDPTSAQFQLIAAAFGGALRFSAWPSVSEKALSFSCNNKLTPGRVDSKLYPSNIRVAFSEIAQPSHSPQRMWWIFTPSVIKGGLIYYPGGCVDGRSYFSLAFEIAARGHLVVIVQHPGRNAAGDYLAANSILDSKHSAFSGVPDGGWAIGGHSAGAFGASMYARECGQRVYALVSHAGGFVDLTQSKLPVLQLYGKMDDLSPGGYDRYRYLFVEPPPRGKGPILNLSTTTFQAIDGANHCQVGDYGYQFPDGIATISLEDQHRAFAEATVAFLDRHLPSHLQQPSS